MAPKKRRRKEDEHYRDVIDRLVAMLQYVLEVFLALIRQQQPQALAGINVLPLWGGGGPPPGGNPPPGAPPTPGMRPGPMPQPFTPCSGGGGRSS